MSAIIKYNPLYNPSFLGEVILRKCPEHEKYIDDFLHSNRGRKAPECFLGRSFRLLPNNVLTGVFSKMRNQICEEGNPQIRAIIKYDPRYSPSPLIGAILRECPEHEKYNAFSEWSSLHEFVRREGDTPSNSLQGTINFQKLCDGVLLGLFERGDFISALRLIQRASNYITLNKPPLANLDSEIERKQKLRPDLHFGVHFHGLGGAIIKEGNVRVEKKDGIYKFQFKINHFARKDIQETLGRLLGTKMIKNGDMQITIESSEYVFPSDTSPDDTSSAGSIVKISYFNSLRQRIGDIVIGNAPEYGCLHNNIEVTVVQQATEYSSLKNLYIFLSLVGLGRCMLPQNEEDDQKMKIAKLFHQFAPKDAESLRECTEFHISDSSKMRQLCEQKNPRMVEIFKKYLPSSLMKKTESYPERLHWTITDMSTLMKENGDLCLGSSITGRSFLKNLIKVLQQGMVCSEDRLRAGMSETKGMSSMSDIQSGGASYIFTRLLTKNLLFQVVDASSSGVLMCFDLSLVNRGGYAYESDQYGDKNKTSPGYFNYQNRLSFPEFARLTTLDCRNEVMIPHYIPPESICCVFTGSQRIKNALIQEMTENNMIQEGRYKTRPIDEFIKIAQQS
jgi:hypothetical protein